MVDSHVMCGPVLLTFQDIWLQPWSLAFGKGWTGLNRCCYPGNICTFRNVMWPVVQFYFSNIFRPAQWQLESGYQVLPPRRRWDLCGQKLRQFRWRDPNLRVVGEARWRCRAQEFFLGLWRDSEMAVGSVRSTLGSEIEKNWRDFHNSRSMLETELDCQLLQVLMFCSFSCPLCEQGAGWLFEFIPVSDFVVCLYIWCKIVDR